MNGYCRLPAVPGYSRHYPGRSGDFGLALEISRAEIGFPEVRFGCYGTVCAPDYTKSKLVPERLKLSVLGGST